MKFHSLWDKYGNCILISLTVIVSVLAMSIFYDFYYSLNDDVMMKDVMAGVYAGTPNGHNMQTLYILGAFISLCYKLAGTLPWYGLFLCLCQMGSLFLVGFRLLTLLKNWQAKITCMALMTLFMWGVILPHMLAVQYTVACTMLAAAAIFLFMTTKKGLSPKEFVIRNIPSILLVILAYNLRSEMLLLVFPLIALAGLFRWVEEEKFFSKENYIKYGIVIGCILAGMLISRLIDFAAYGSEGWRAAVEFFDKRTEVYDFHYDILTSGEHSEYLSSIGLSDAQQELLANYNFGLDEDIDEKVMAEIAAYAADITADGVTGEQTFTDRIITKGREYIYRTFHIGDAPYNLLVITGYACVFVSGFWYALKGGTDKKRWSFIWELVVLGIFRTILWMYIMLKGRDPERITHSLYLAEFMVLMGMLCIHSCRFKNKTGKQEDTNNFAKLQNVGPAANTIIFIYILLISIICLTNLTRSINAVSADAKIREEANRGAEAISQYCRSHPENFYFEDVYSTVSFSQKIFKNVDNSLTNYDIMGGWMCKTPLYKEKLRVFGIDNTADGLLMSDGVYFIVDKDEDSGTDWLIEYYTDKGYSVSLRQTDLIYDKYEVYQVMEN
ncbi:MAG: hypothetical protein J1E98_04960 [Lachnospiraceae bacterium]|nr:hypothetical protein [Lachnospiraceae bacterium]